jgi:CheY-like chemotaxis protein
VDAFNKEHLVPGKRVLSIGQCAADHAAIARVFRQHFAAEVVAADSAQEALSALSHEEFSLLLVNRILDVDGSSGIELLKHLKKNHEFSCVPAMLVSNYEDAQQEAVQAGAAPGFGKAALGQPAMLGRVRTFLE